ncbi:glycosyltransferase family 4 protein [Christiangramia aestuarii]|nr:glycosyltransferase family 4 protein [Christiangramia aestuarii]
MAPTFNHYKARFLSRLSSEELSLTVLAGSGRGIKDGDKEIESEKWSFLLERVNIPKEKFGNSSIVRMKLKKEFKNFNWVLLPAEKKNLPLLLYCLILKRRYKHVKLFSYNHPVFKSKGGKVTLLDKILTKFFFNRLDRVIFYTEESCKWAIENKFINPKKAFWANNTIDTQEITRVYNFQLPNENEPRILFIGRLIPSKKLDVLFEYYSHLSALFKSKGKCLKLDIIGDGPEAKLVQEKIEKDEKIRWHGALVNEDKISEIIKNCSLVFVPGHSGLSINHAFAYGRPYITLESIDHAPEISYLQHGKNGWILSEDQNQNVRTIADLLLDREKLQSFCRNAERTGNFLSVENWRSQFSRALMHA